VTSHPEAFELPADTETWPALFDSHGLDCIMDPMVLRAADFFIGGRDYCRRMAPGATSDPWPAIKSNLDGILAFFHILMTRDHVPFIDYWETYSSDMPGWLGNSIPLMVSGGAAYRGIKEAALEKLSSVIPTLPAGASLDRDRELLAFGNFWNPGLGSVQVAPEARSAAQFVLGGLVFGEYAQRGGADHLLQCKRLGLMSTPQRHDAKPKTDFAAEEAALFAEITRIANRNELSFTDQEALPNVLLHLIAEKERSPRAILDAALRLRETDEGLAYRDLNRRLRQAWSVGRRDGTLQAELNRVAVELGRRLSGKPMHITAVSIGGTLEVAGGPKADLGIFKFEARGSIKATLENINVRIEVPAGVRNWFVDRFLLKKHQKILLRMARDQHSFTDVGKALEKVWRHH
jgi:hypothetical protein